MILVPAVLVIAGILALVLYLDKRDPVVSETPRRDQASAAQRPAGGSDGGRRDGPPIALTLLSLVVAVLALLATWWQGSIARDAEKRSLRAYATYDEPLVTSVTNPAGRHC